VTGMAGVRGNQQVDLLVGTSKAAELYTGDVVDRLPQHTRSCALTSDTCGSSRSTRAFVFIPSLFGTFRLVAVD
jgi:hypothetical protein